jgi:hypothetical protein
LFSLFVFFPGCKKNSKANLIDSYEQGDYGKTVEIARNLISESVQAEYLFWEAKANIGLGQNGEAFQELDLFLAMTDAKDENWREAALLMCQIAFQQKKYLRVVESARNLETLGWLGESGPRYYYEALFALNQKELANQVFATYLKDSIDENQYAKILLETKTIGKALSDAFSVLTLTEQLALLEFAASDTVSSSYANELLKLAIPLEQSIEDNLALKRVYSVLEILYGYADQRVLQRKYATLANK